MRSTLLVAAVAVLVATASTANTYKVTNTNNTGVGSLRRALTLANTHVGADKIVFAPSLNGAVLKPTNALPTLTDAGTTIEGDVDGDSLPDIGLNGQGAGDAHGLSIQADDCVISGLAILRFRALGISIFNSRNCLIRKCYVGVGLNGQSYLPNGADQIYVHYSSLIHVGDSEKLGPMVIAVPTAASGHSGIYIRHSKFVHVERCNVGVGRDGKTVLATPALTGTGLTLYGTPAKPPPLPLPGEAHQQGGAGSRCLLLPAPPGCAASVMPPRRP